MRCSYCRKKEAELVVRTVVKKRLTRIFLCKSCIAKKEKQLGLEPGALSAFAVEINPDIFAREAAHGEIICKKCGLSYADFRKTGLIGCPSCYKYFSENLCLLLKHISGAENHPATEYKPQGDRSFYYKAMPAQELKAELETALKEEDFEKAAFLRKFLEGKAEKNEN